MKEKAIERDIGACGFFGNIMQLILQKHTRLQTNNKLGVGMIKLQRKDRCGRDLFDRHLLRVLQLYNSPIEMRSQEEGPEPEKRVHLL